MSETLFSINLLWLRDLIRLYIHFIICSMHQSLQSLSVLLCKAHDWWHEMTWSFSKNCLDQICLLTVKTTSWIRHNFLFWQLSVLTGVRYLQTSLENVLRQGDPECESDGWLLENSFVETARSNFNIIKHLGKFNQINISSNGDPNIDKPSTAHYGPDNVPPKPLPTAS